MAQINYIKHLYESEEKSLNEISKITGFNYRTVTKYAYMDNWSKDNLPNIEPQSYPVLGDFIPIIDEWLENDRKVPRKQRHTIWRIFCRLRDEEGYDGSYSSVKRYVRKKKYVMKQASEGYLPLAQPQGHAQVDFGEFIYYDGDHNEQSGSSLTVTFPYSNKGYIQVFQSQNQECLLTGLQRIFEHIGGVPLHITADNMTTAVAHMLVGHERVMTDGFARFKLHYRFDITFCNPAAGYEKGNVENKVGYGRRNALVPVPTITSFDDYNEYLWTWCEKDALRNHYIHGVPIQSLWEEEKEKLLTLPEYPYQVFRYEALRVNKCGFATVDKNKYGLPPSLYGETVQAKIFFDHIEFYHDHQPVGEYKRSYGNNEECMNWTYYVSALCKKPGAAPHTRFFHTIPKQWQQHISATDGTERRNALQLLNEIVADGNAPLCVDALTLAGENGRTDADSIRQCYYMIAKKEHHPEPMKISCSAPVLNYNPNLTAYDGLTGGEIHV